MKVAKISALLAIEITGDTVPGQVRKFYPIQDADGNWVISLLEAAGLEPGQWEEIDWNEPII